MDSKAGSELAGEVFAELDVYRDAEVRSVAMNMAVDEALLELATAPTLRLYQWQRPSLSFGYFGKYADVAAEESQREIVRRWTGGGSVMHGEDLTYSVVIPNRGAAARPSSRAVYSCIHEAIRVALSDHATVQLATHDAPKESDACFANPVTADVLLDGKKIAGAAHRRTRAGLLHQGSIQFEGLPAHFAEAFAAALSPRRRAMFFTIELLQRAEDLVTQKYGTAPWLRLR